MRGVWGEVSVGKTKVLRVGKSVEEVVCTLNGKVLEQVFEFTYLGTVSSELVKAFERKKGNAVARPLRSHVFYKNEAQN